MQAQPQGSGDREPSFAVGRGLQLVFDAIEESRRLLALPDDWDGEGSQGYSEATWARASSFVREGAVYWWDSYQRRVAPPEFVPGPEGAIDVEWSVDGRELIIRVPSEEGQEAKFYAHGECCSIKGTLNPACPDSRRLLAWMAE